MNIETRKNDANTKIEIGVQAPDFVLPDQANNPVRLSDYVGKNVVVLYFYPKDFTGGCTAEACSFRDSYEDFKAVGATVIGVSEDSVDSHESFARRYQLPFILLSDRDGAVQKLYGLNKTFGIIRGRVTFVIDQQGVVRHTFSSQLNVGKHVTEALQIVRDLAKGNSL